MKNKRKGISSIMGTILILSITLALGGLLYGYSKGLFDNLTSNVQVEDQFNLVVTPSGQGFIQYNIKNAGNVALHLETIQVNGQNVTLNYILQPGQSVQGVREINNLTAGNYYPVIVYALTTNGQSYTSVSTVLAEE
ncbi:pilin subunit UpsA [Metallosphaera yellowstonensis]|nr:archaellin/type IV pilin N-terminal domain-containing protein [Metallosphaera yellowstonensis]